MEKLSLLIIFMISLFYSQLWAQKKLSIEEKQAIGVSFSSFGKNDVFRFEELDGAPSYQKSTFYNFGINYLRVLNPWLQAETGIEYSHQTIIVSSNLPPQTVNYYEKTTLSMVNIPLTVRVNFLKYFFINGGIIVDIHSTKNALINKTTGIGALLGIATKYDVKNGISVFLNPYLKILSLIPIPNIKNNQMIQENGIRIGIQYHLPSKKIIN